MGIYRSCRGKPHWSERSWSNPRRWIAAPLVVGALGACAAWVGLWLQIAAGGFSAWGFLALAGVMLLTGALAWAQSDLNRTKGKRR